MQLRDIRPDIGKLGPIVGAIALGLALAPGCNSSQGGKNEPSATGGNASGDAGGASGAGGSAPDAQPSDVGDSDGSDGGEATGTAVSGSVKGTSADTIHTAYWVGMP